ncbi:hypothetical protein HNV12_12670 [Methanococcoides sp. SA1]|nr:hypothetical protein [Methanococcoides sp. SA1]
MSFQIDQYLTYRSNDIYSYKLAASKVVPNVKIEKLSELLTGIAEILKERKSPEYFVKKQDCEHLCSNYTDFQNLLYQIGFLDKRGAGKYILTSEGTRIADGEPFCKHLPEALLNLVKSRHEENRHALLLLWIYYHASVNGQPRPEHFQKMGEDNSYPKIRYEVGKTMMVLLSNCFGNDIEKIHGFFDEWEQLLH